MHSVVEKLNTEKGGLIPHIIGVCTPTPLENIEHLAQACYRYCLRKEVG